MAVKYFVIGMSNWLQRYGFSYKKPALVSGKADKQQKQEWLVKYEKLKHNLSVDETICFMYGVHPTHNIQTANGWIKKGKRKEISVNSGRSRLNLSGVLDVIFHKVFIQEDKMLNTDSTINFIRKVEKSYPEKNKIYLYCDNARYYREIVKCCVSNL